MHATLGHTLGRYLITGLLAALLAALVPSPAPAGPSEPAPGAVVLQRITIQVEDSHPDGFDWPGLARAVIGWHRREALTQDKLQQSIKALEPLAQVTTRVSGSEAVIVLRPRKRIKSIATHGNYPLFEQDVRDAMTIYPGAIFSPRTAIPKQRELLVQRYQEEGYIDPEVRIDWEQDRDDGHYHLSVKINKGPYYALQEVRLTGNRAIDGRVLKASMATWRRATIKAGLGRFKARQVKVDLERLVAYYRKKGYADAAAVHQLEMDAARRRAVLEIRIYEGPLYRVSLAGNRSFSDGTLRKDLVLRTIGNRNNSGLYRSMRNIRQRYLNAGFANVRVRRREPADPSPAQRQIVIEIDEGLRHMVGDVTIRGHHFFETQTIRRQMLTAPAKGWDDGVYVAQVLQEDMNAIQSLYLQYGFLQTVVEEQVDIDPATGRAGIVLNITEGVQTRVGQVSVEGDPPMASADLQAMLQHQPGEAFQAHLVREDENRLAARIAAMGHPHVRVTGQVTYADDQRLANIAFRVDAGPLVRVGDLFFTGNFRTRTRLMQRQAGLKNSAPFDPAQVLEAQRNLRDLNLFDSVQVRTIGLKEKAVVVPLLVEVVEKKPYFFEIGGGFETDKGLFARSRIGDGNFFGTNRQIWLGGEVSGIGHRLDTGVSAPNIFGTRIRADVGLFVEREEEFNQDFGTDSYGGNLNLSRRLNPEIVAALGWRYENREQFLREQDASSDVDPEALEPRRILVTTPTVWYDTRDSLIRPREGWYSRLTVDLSNGLDNELDDFLRYQFDVRHFYPLNSRLVLAAVARVGYLVGDGDEARVPEDQLFFLGGTTDVRGFAENLLRFDAEGDPVGSRLALSGNLEARYDLGGNVELTAFLDGGSLQMATDDAGTDDWRWSVGLGLSYITPIGPIGLFYGHKLDPLEDEGGGQFHFSIGYTF